MAVRKLKGVANITPFLIGFLLGSAKRYNDLRTVTLEPPPVVPPLISGDLLLDTQI